MGVIKTYFKKMLEDIFVNMTNRMCVQLQLFCIAAGSICIIMTILNGVRGESILGVETGIGTLLSVFIYIYTQKTKKYKIGSLCFAFGFLSIFFFFLVSGVVEGFATLWFCLYPFICLFILDVKMAILFIMFGFGILVAFLWTPLLKFIPDVYTQNFVIRFPFFYIGNFIFAWALNGFYAYTYNKLLEINQKFEQLSNQDGLTKLANRNCLNRFKSSILEKGEQKFYAVMLDVDYFKQYNDTYGHIAGDEVLKLIANEIIEVTKGKNLFATRYGGEEFLILMQQFEENEVVEFAEMLRNRIHNLKMEHCVGDGYVTISVGISGQDVDSEEQFVELLKQTDKALYWAKQNGRNQVCVYGSIQEHPCL